MNAKKKRSWVELSASNFTTPEEGLVDNSLVPSKIPRTLKKENPRQYHADVIDHHSVDIANENPLLYEIISKFSEWEALGNSDAINFAINNLLGHPIFCKSLFANHFMHIVAHALDSSTESLQTRNWQSLASLFQKNSGKLTMVSTNVFEKQEIIQLIGDKDAVMTIQKMWNIINDGNDGEKQCGMKIIDFMSLYSKLISCPSETVDRTIENILTRVRLNIKTESDVRLPNFSKSCRVALVGLHQFFTLLEEMGWQKPAQLFLMDGLIEIITDSCMTNKNISGKKKSSVIIYLALKETSNFYTRHLLKSIDFSAKPLPYGTCKKYVLDFSKGETIDFESMLQSILSRIEYAVAKKFAKFEQECKCPKIFLLQHSEKCNLNFLQQQYLHANMEHDSFKQQCHQNVIAALYKHCSTNSNFAKWATETLLSSDRKLSITRFANFCMTEVDSLPLVHNFDSLQNIIKFFDFFLVAYNDDNILQRNDSANHQNSKIPIIDRIKALSLVDKLTICTYPAYFSISFDSYLQVVESICSKMPISLLMRQVRENGGNRASHHVAKNVSRCIKKRVTKGKHDVSKLCIERWIPYTKVSLDKAKSGMATAIVEKMVLNYLCEMVVAATIFDKNRANNNKLNKCIAYMLYQTRSGSFPPDPKDASKRFIYYVTATRKN